MNTAFPAPIKLGRGLAHVMGTTKRTDLVVGGRRIRTSSRSTAFPAPIKLGKGLPRVTATMSSMLTSMSGTPAAMSNDAAR